LYLKPIVIKLFETIPHHTVNIWRVTSPSFFLLLASHFRSVFVTNFIAVPEKNWYYHIFSGSPGLILKNICPESSSEDAGETSLLERRPC